MPLALFLSKDGSASIKPVLGVAKGGQPGVVDIYPCFYPTKGFFSPVFGGAPGGGRSGDREKGKKQSDSENHPIRLGVFPFRRALGWGFRGKPKVGTSLEESCWGLRQQDELHSSLTPFFQQ